MNAAIFDYTKRQKISDVVSVHTVNDRPAVSVKYLQTGVVTSQRQFDSANDAQAYAESLVGGSVAHEDELKPASFESGSESEYQRLQVRAAQMRKLRLSRKS